VLRVAPTTQVKHLEGPSGLQAEQRLAVHGAQFWELPDTS